MTADRRVGVELPSKRRVWLRVGLGAEIAASRRGVVRHICSRLSLARVICAALGSVGRPRRHHRWASLRRFARQREAERGRKEAAHQAAAAVRWLCRTRSDSASDEGRAEENDALRWPEMPRRGR